MLSQKNRIKAAAFVVLIFQMLFLNGAFVFAQGYNSDSFNFSDGGGSFDIPEPMSVGDAMMDKYNVNSDSLKNMTQGFNVSSNKIYTPEVKLSFNPSEPKEGEQITAKALPMYFTNPKEELYYTWYLVRKGCDSGNKSSCDADRDGNVDTNDWKVTAMRLIATQGYDNQQDEPTPDYSGDGDNDEYRAYYGGGDKGAQGDTTGNDTLYTVSAKHCYIYDAESGQTLEMPRCEHLFPSYPNDYPTDNNDCPGIDENDTPLHISSSVGDGSFGHNEECFWKTNPQNPNTAGNGNMDEANVVGKGQDTFSWTYQPGDKVGVAIEGTSIIATKYENSSFMTMWAFPKNKFDISGTGTKMYCQPASNASGDYSPVCGAGYFDVSIPTANNTLEDAFENNLVDPAEQTSEKLDVSLSYTPENPTNDTSGDKLGDVLSVNSSIANISQDPSQIHYDWKVSIGTSISGDFDDISSDLEDADLISGKLSGLNNPQIGIKLNLGEDYGNYFENGVAYLKIKLKAKESIPEKVRVGNGEIIVRVNASGSRIRVYLTSSLDGQTLESREDANLICNGSATLGGEASPEDKMNYYVCPVVKNQILRLESNVEGMTDFSWSVDGANINCDSSLSPDCSRGSVAFLPVLGNSGEEANVKMTAKNITNGKTIELSKKFQVVKPYIKFISNDLSTFWPKLLGYYNDLDGSPPFPDYSDSVFNTYFGSSVEITAEYHPTWLEQTGILNSAWTVDGDEQTVNVATVLNFPVTKNIGEVHNINFSSFYVATNEIRRILKNYWGVPQTSSSGELISGSITGEVVPDNLAGPVSLKSPGKFLASIVSNLPSQALFLLRTVLVVFVIILMAGLAMNFSPSFGKDKQ